MVSDNVLGQVTFSSDNITYFSRTENGVLGKIFIKGQEVDRVTFPKKQGEILQLLLNNPGSFISINSLCRNNNVKKARISQMRAKLREACSDVKICNTRGEGYKLQGHFWVEMT